MKYLIMLTMLALVGCGNDGRDGADGIQGIEGKNGENGKDGDKGDKGNTGDQGPAGSNGTVITVVQLCPATFVPSYPSSFPEVAVCINNQLYGVYSANGGFLALLTPGTYVSHGINVDCTLIILPNCIVH